jgi:hypothetical protein
MCLIVYLDPLQRGVPAPATARCERHVLVRDRGVGAETAHSSANMMVFIPPSTCVRPAFR